MSTKSYTHFAGHPAKWAIDLYVEAIKNPPCVKIDGVLAKITRFAPPVIAS